MTLNLENLSAEHAFERSKWCSEMAEALRDQCRNSNEVARSWWEAEAASVDWLDISPRLREMMMEFADRLQEKGYEWAGVSGELYAKEDGY